MPSELATLVAKKFVARADVRAVQLSNGDYQPDRLSRDKDEFYPLTIEDIDFHLAKTKTFGHYILNKNNRCKLFTLDIDLEKTGYWVPETMDSDGDIEPREFNPREAWRDRAHPARTSLKTEMREIANELMKFIFEEMHVPTACAYSGNKGVHVYGFTGPIDAADARFGAKLVMDSLNFVAIRGESTFMNPKFPNFSIEIYPKQDKLSDQGGFGNLVRLPLGVNLKAPADPTFFVDMTAPMNELRPLDPVWALTEGADNPWKQPNE